MARLLYSLGNLRLKQGRPDEAYECHQRAFRGYVETTGAQYHRTADTRHKLAEHLIRLEKFDEAM